MVELKHRMARKKLIRAAAIKTLPNVFEWPREMKGHWNARCFRNDNPIIMELACGEGFYTNALAAKYPQKNLIGVDFNAERIWRGARAALEQNLSNVVYVKILIEFIYEFFAPQEVSEIWLTFPDPYPKRRHAKHRLTSPHFLQSYKKIMKPGGIIHLKTDDPGLYEYTLRSLEKEKYGIEVTTDDLYARDINDDLLLIKTKFERKFLNMGKAIKYIRFRNQG
ncbi:tRNA (guanosine(46)-N7)-methyltransferase TrmB [candidate division KSB1 bacterium]|nr:tRNA (guanosine(46)-N7)-methyltransferase TrmB [candidate division KSB1 bacterium]